MCIEDKVWKKKELYFKYEEIINYLIVGALTTLITLITYFLFTNTFLSSKTDLDIQIANVLSWICAVIFAYFTNRKYVFKSKVKGQKQVKEIINFFGSRVASLLIDMSLMFLLFSIMHINDAICKLITQGVVIVMNYVLAKIIVFKKKD